MLTDLERDLRDALAREAGEVDLATAEWTGPRPIATPRRSRRLLAVAAAAVAVMGIGSLWLQRSPSESSIPQTETTVPAGVEVQLQPILLDDLRWAPAPFVVGAVRPGSFRAYTVDGLQFVVYESIEHRGGPGVVEVRCVEDQATLASCRPIRDRPLAIEAGMLRVWSDVPAGTAVVTARTEVGMRWQRPVDGTVAFTHPGTLEAFDADGRVLARLDQRQALLDSVDPRADGAVYDSLGWDGKTKVAIAGISAALRCMGDHGIASDPRDPVRMDAPLDEFWAECVSVANADAAKRFDQLGGQVVTDPDDDPTWGDVRWRRPDVDIVCVATPGGGETCKLHVPVPTTVTDG